MALPFSVPVPSAVAPSRKVTVPVGVPEALEVSVEVNVTPVPQDAEAAEETSATVVAAGEACVMVSDTASEVPALNLESPP